MGAQGSKPSTRPTEMQKCLTPIEINHIRDLFDSIAEPKVANLLALWNRNLDPHLKELVINYLSRSKKKTTIDFRDFQYLFASFARGTADDKAELLVDMLTNFQRTEPIPRSTVLEYVESLIRSYILLHSDSGWRESTPAEVKYLSETLCGDLSPEIDYEDLSRWIVRNPNVSAVQASVVGKLYSLKTLKQRLVPTRDKKRSFSVLDVGSVMYVNAALPAALRNEWRLLFSSLDNGESFSKLMGLIQNQGPTLVIVVDKKGYVFGGFAPHSWILAPNFAGDETSFLFRLKPNMEVHTATHYNDHYQYVNNNQQTMPNGLGMGGQFGYWGLWLDAEYGKGQTSETCTTFHQCKLLSGAKDFTIDHLEVWAVGPLPVEESHRSGCSILDGNTEAKAMLEMVGKGAHSAGYREPIEEDYD